MMLIYGIRHSFSVFFPYILDDFGWSRGSTAFMLSLNVSIYGFAAPLAGALGDRWRPRLTMSLGVLTLGLITAACSLASQLWHFYVLFGLLMPFATAMCGWPLLVPALANWFAERRGLVIGIGQASSGLSFTYGIIAEMAISEVGWRSAYIVIAVILAAVVLPLYVFFFHYRPESRGLKPYGAGGAGVDSGSAGGREASNYIYDWTLKQAVKSHRLWLLVVSQSLFWGIAGYLVLAHQVKFAQDIGYSSSFAVSVFALFGVFMTAGMLSAFISDRIGREVTVTLGIALTIAALVSLLSATDTSKPFLLYAYSVLFGYGVGLYIPTVFAGTADIFHGRNFGAICGVLMTGLGVGGVIGPWLGGFLHDVSGSYLSSFIISIMLIGLSGVAFWIAAPRHAGAIRRTG